jgi:hypothetical protein
MPVSLAAVEHAWIPRSADAWWLRVVWRIANSADRALHVLVAGPICIREGAAMVLDHTVRGQPDNVDWNIQPDLAFGVARAGGTLDIDCEYPLPQLAAATEVTLVARMSVGYEPPGPDWATRRMWEAVESWETILESSLLRLRTPATPRG